MKLLLLSFFLLSAAASKAQSSKAYVFLEPNVSIDYDSNFIRKGKFNTNDFNEPESFDFHLKDLTRTRMTVKTTPGSGRPFSQEKTDQFMIERLPMLKKMPIDSMVITRIDTAVRHIAAFSCTGIAFRGKYEPNRAGIIIIANHLSPEDATEVDFLALNNGDLDQAYASLQKFLQGFTFYSREIIRTEDSLVKKMYTVEVMPAKDTGRSFIQPTFTGNVKVKEPLRHRIESVHTRSSYIGDEKFFPAPGGDKVLIRILDKEKGTVEKTGYLILLNSFGGKVWLPFEFTYINN